MAGLTSTLPNPSRKSEVELGRSPCAVGMEDGVARVGTFGPFGLAGMARATRRVRVGKWAIGA